MISTCAHTCQRMLYSVSTAAEATHIFIILMVTFKQGGFAGSLGPHSACIISVSEGKCFLPQ